MPNHITNVLYIIGKEKAVNLILNNIKKDFDTDKEDEMGTIDFNKIIPMPDHIYRGDLGQDEYEKYGKNNWYDWSIENWGTKWNAYDFEEFYDPFDLGELGVIFNTAWSMPEPIIQKLSEQYPECIFKLYWADEDLGQNLGMIVFQNGKQIELYEPEGGTDEALRFACVIKGYDFEEITAPEPDEFYI